MAGLLRERAVVSSKNHTRYWGQVAAPVDFPHFSRNNKPPVMHWFHSKLKARCRREIWGKMEQSGPDNDFIPDGDTHDQHRSDNRFRRFGRWLCRFSHPLAEN